MSNIIKRLLIIYTIFCVTGCACHKKEASKNEEEIIKEEMINIEDKIIEDKTLENNIIARQTNLVTTDGQSELTTEIYNDSLEDIYIKYLDIIFKDEDGNEIKKLIGYVGQTIKSKKSEYVVTSINTDLSATKEIEYKINY